MSGGIFGAFLFLTKIQFFGQKFRFGHFLGQFLQKSVQNFFRRFWGAKLSPHFYPTNLPAAIAAATTKLAENQTPDLACKSVDEFSQGPCEYPGGTRGPGAGCAKR